jgi:hypothetical protein
MIGSFMTGSANLIRNREIQSSDGLKMSERENRDSHRFHLELPVRVRWKDLSGKSRETTGMTRNVSRSGAFIVCDTPMREGCAVDFEVELPLPLAGSIKSRTLARGRVVRNSSRGERVEGYEHGIRFDRFIFARF